MRIVNLVENTEGEAGCRAEHGLCFYIETERHKILMDAGQTDLLLENAEKLSIDLTAVDTLILSHGHYDHSGGIIPFSKINQHAKIYIKRDAFGDYYSMSHGPEPRYIGIDPEIRDLNVVLIDGTVEIDEELTIFTGIGTSKPWPLTNSLLLKKINGEMVKDDFMHEQCLRIKQNGKTYLLSGCAHHGILNVLDRYKSLYGNYPDCVISGMHTMRKTGYSDEDINYIQDIAHEMAKTNTIFYTGHCTGVEPYRLMKEIMGDQIHYVHCGDEICDIAFQLVPIEKKDLPILKHDMQEAFQLRAELWGDGSKDKEILPESHIDKSLCAKGAIAYKAVVDGEMIGGAIVGIHDKCGQLDFLYVKSGMQSKGIGQRIWKAIEEKHPFVTLWETFTPYFDTRNLHFYINSCGFAAVEFYNPKHIDPNAPDGDDGSDLFFRFEKRMVPETSR